MLRTDQLAVVVAIILGACAMGAGFLNNGRYVAVGNAAFVYVIDHFTGQVVSTCTAGACERR